jgi:hypothetical protein
MLLEITNHSPSSLLNSASPLRLFELTHHATWEDVFVAFDGMAFVDSNTEQEGCKPRLRVTSASPRGGRARGVDGPAAFDEDHALTSLALSTSECAQECFLRGRDHCRGFSMIFEPRLVPRVLSRHEQDLRRRGACELLVDARESCRLLAPTASSFPMPIAFLWREDVHGAVSAGHLSAHGLRHRMGKSLHEVAAVARSVVFLILSSPENLEERMRAAWRTWLAAASNVAVFVESRHRSGSEVENQTLNFVRGRSRVSPRRQMEIYVQLPEPSNLRVRHINGAWKPLAILQFMFAAHNDTALRSVFAGSDWFVMADDDTYIVTHNLYVFLLSRAKGEGAERIEEAVMVGERFSFASMGKKVEYLQGGAGVLLSRTAMYHPNLQAMFGPDDFVAERNCSSRFIVLRAEPSDTLTINVQWQTMSLTAVCHSDAVVEEAGTLWPAGDMRLAWVAHEAHRRGEGRGLPLRVEHGAGFWHRSVQLALGLDRRGERSAYPISFHRARNNQQIDELHEAVTKALELQQRLLWPELASLVLRWSSLEAFFADAFVADSDAFLEDDGWT